MSRSRDRANHQPLLGHLERARRLGFLGRGPVSDHLEHAAGFVRALEEVAGTVVDLGSGGGVPGLVIAVARPDLSLVLVETRARCCRFLEDAIGDLGLATQVVEGRAEAIGRGELRGGADGVVARSFGAPAVTAECAAPLLRVGGMLVVSEPPHPTPHRWPEHGLIQLGLRVGARSATGPAMQVLRQVAPCPPGFPRGVGRPAKRPLF